MPRRFGRGRHRGGRVRTRTVTRTRTRFRNIRGRISGFRARHRSKVDHVALISAGAGVGALITTGIQIAQKNGMAVPSWLSKVLSLAGGTLLGKHIGHSWTKGIESGISAVATSFVEDRVISGQPILNLSLGGGGQQMLPQGSVY